MEGDLELRDRFIVDDLALASLHARVFGYQSEGSHPLRLERHSLTWVDAFVEDSLIDFVHACWDGGEHAFVLDTIVDPEDQRRGVEQALVEEPIEQATASGCRWLDVDYEPTQLNLTNIETVVTSPLPKEI